MIYTEYIKIKSCILHNVGNKGIDQGITLTHETIDLDDETGKILEQYILGQVITDGYYEFWHESDLALNELYAFVKQCFDDESSFIEVSQNIAKQLYSCSTHPKIKGGELCVVLFKNVIVDGVTCDAIGLFKSENKDTFLKLISDGKHTEIYSDTGININKLDKAAVIFNTQAESGYWVTVVDKTNKATEAKYWTDDFLKVKPCKNSFNQTENLISTTSAFVAQLPDECSKTEKAMMVSRSMQAISQPTVVMEDYAMEVFKDKDLAKQFDSYSRKQAEEDGVWYDDEITISQQAVKKKAATTLTMVKLDNNFDIRIHGGEHMIEQGYDEERGMKYYKLFYKAER